MGTLFHYTNLESLALILKHGTIKFSNLEYLDDPFEKKLLIKTFTKDNPRLHDEWENYGKFCYVSCWTAVKEESIPMWDMYADRKRGVRIELPVDMFDKQFNINERKPFSKPLFHVEHKCVQPELIKVDYRKRSDQEPFIWLTGFDMDRLGRYKSPAWKFQKEYRFRLYGCLDEDGFTKTYYSSAEIMNNKIALDRPTGSKDVFFKLDGNVIPKIKILKGPDMKEGEEELLLSLAMKHKICPESITWSKFHPKDNE